jgi:hypothetical protein
MISTSPSLREGVADEAIHKHTRLPRSPKGSLAMTYHLGENICPF